MEEDRQEKIEIMIDKYETKRDALGNVSKKLTEMGFEFTAKEFQVRGIFDEFINNLESLL